MAIGAWEKIDGNIELKVSFAKNFQDISEPYAEFIDKLMDKLEIRKQSITW